MMTYPDILAALARERVNTFLSEAQAARQAGLARAARSPARVELRDGFITLGGIQIAATALILVCAARYKDTPCPSHLPRQPAAKPATGTGTSGTEPGSWRPPGRPVVAASAAPAGRGGAPRAVRPRPGPAIPCGH